MANNFLNPLAVTPYFEQMHTNNRRMPTRHRQPSTTAKPKPKFSVNPYQDQERIITALQELSNNGIPPTVIDHLISRPTKCIEECIFLLQQVLLNVDRSWISNVAHSLHEPEAVEVTAITQQQPRHVHRGLSFRSNKSQLSGTTIASGGFRQSFGQLAIAKMPSEAQTSASTFAMLPLPQVSDECYLNTNHQHYTYPGSPASGMLSSMSPSCYGTPLLNPENPDPSNFTDLPWLEESAHQTTLPFQDGGLEQSLRDPQPFAPTHDNLYHPESHYPPTSYSDQQTVVPGGHSQPTISLVAPSMPPKMLHADQPSQSHDTSQSISDSTFIPYTKPLPRKEVYRSPCPRCDSHFSKRQEFLSHVLAEHDQPVQFFCLHKVLCRNQPTGCGFMTWRSAQFNMHHTKFHAECRGLQNNNQGQPPCRQEVNKVRPNRVWGCWFCIWATSNLNSWVIHHMEKHFGCSRRQMSVTWLVKSLLSQDLLQALWQNEIDKLNESTGHRWDFRWSDDPDCELIRELETGFWGNQDFHTDMGARQGIVKAAMDATKLTKIDLGPALVDDRRNGKRPPTSSPTGVRHHGVIRRVLSLGTQKNKSNLDQ